MHCIYILHLFMCMLRRSVCSRMCGVREKMIELEELMDSSNRKENQGISFEMVWDVQKRPETAPLCHTEGLHHECSRNWEKGKTTRRDLKWSSEERHNCGATENNVVNRVVGKVELTKSTWDKALVTMVTTMMIIYAYKHMYLCMKWDFKCSTIFQGRNILPLSH